MLCFLYVWNNNEIIQIKYVHLISVFFFPRIDFKNSRILLTEYKNLILLEKLGSHSVSSLNLSNWFDIGKIQM